MVQFLLIALNKRHRREVYNHFPIDNKHTSFNMCVSPINRNKTSKIKFIKYLINGISNQ